jgi:dTMP kinase
MFITFEGPDGSGKTTQIKMLADYLESRGKVVLHTREPGGTVISEQIRQVILSKKNLEMQHETEALLFSAARAQIVSELIRPALAEGKIVLCDRYADSTMAYQGYGLGLDIDALRVITRFATGGLAPDLTLYIDVPVEVGLARRQQIETNRLDVKAADYHRRVREGFMQLVRAEPQRWVVIVGTQAIDDVQQEIRKELEKRLGDG